MAAFSTAIEQSGIAVVTFDLPGKSVNILTTPVMDELSDLLDGFMQRKDLRGLLFVSGKESSFIAGADITEIRAVTDAATGSALSRRGQDVFAKIEALPFPTAAAIHGPCLGGGMELALACDFRVISSDPKTVLGQPEVRIGIMPGFGGTQRLPRLTGAAAALDLILTGKSVYANKARRLGLADEVAPRELLRSAAIRIVHKAAGAPKPRGIRGRRPLLIRLLESNALTRMLIFARARAATLRETRGNYPAPLAALESIRYGLSRVTTAGYRRESELIGRLIATPVSKNLIRVFNLSEEFKRAGAAAPAPVKSAAVVGAGIMGGGIAQLFAEKGIPVRMKDVTNQALSAGLKAAAGIFGKRRKKGVLSPLEARDGMDRITAATDYSGLRNVDLAVEAVVENMAVKQSVLREFEQAAGAAAIFASNTSSLAITELAEAATRPELVVGMHFFNPVEKMPLVEVIRGARTSEKTVSAVAALARKLGKLPVVVNDGPGFLVNRILMPYLGEAVRMLEEGTSIAAIDGALMRFGMPMGAFILLDEIGIDVAAKVADILYRGLGERAKPSPLLAALAAGGFLGKKNGKGFYRYEGKKRKEVDASIPAGSAAPNHRRTASADEIVDRAVLLMVKEAALCLEEKIIDRADHLDGALIFGIGFPPFRGGLLHYAEDLGLRTVVEKLEALATKQGDRFSPPRLLLDLAREGKNFA